MNKKAWGLAVLAVLIVGTGAAWKTGLLALPGSLSAMAKPGEGKDGKGDKPAVPLEFLTREVVVPSLARLPERLSFSGTLVAPQTAVVRAQAGGTLVSLTVAEGAHVRRGQVVGQIDLAQMDTRIAERRAQIDAVRATLVQAERAHAGNVQLAAQQFISGAALDNSRAGVDTARANLQAAQAALETTRVGLRDAVVSAPIAGIVAKRHVLPGEKVSPEQNLLTIVDISRLELAGQVGTHQVARLQPGMVVQVQVEGLAEPVTGQLVRIAPMAEPGTRSIGVTVALDNPKERLRAGPYAMASVTLPDTVERLTLPQSAVGRTSGQDHVWLIEGGTLARRAVQLGRRDDSKGMVEVLQGVAPGSQVLAARFENLREGAKALVVTSTAPGAGASTAAVAPAADAPVSR